MAPLTWNSGSPEKKVDPALRPETIMRDAIQALATSLAWVRRASLGDPVVPPVPKIEAVSCG